jgi:hypothetical protein
MVETTTNHSVGTNGERMWLRELISISGSLMCTISLTKESSIEMAINFTAHTLTDIHVYIKEI